MTSTEGPPLLPSAEQPAASADSSAASTLSGEPIPSETLPLAAEMTPEARKTPPPERPSTPLLPHAILTDTEIEYQREQGSQDDDESSDSRSFSVERTKASEGSENSIKSPFRQYLSSVDTVYRRVAFIYSLPRDEGGQHRVSHSPFPYNALPSPPPPRSASANTIPYQTEAGSNGGDDTDSLTAFYPRRARDLERLLAAAGGTTSFTPTVPSSFPTPLSTTSGGVSVQARHRLAVYERAEKDTEMGSLLSDSRERDRSSAAAEREATATQGDGDGSAQREEPAPPAEREKASTPRLPALMSASSSTPGEEETPHLCAASPKEYVVLQPLIDQSRHGSIRRRCSSRRRRLGSCCRYVSGRRGGLTPLGVPPFKPTPSPPARKEEATQGDVSLAPAPPLAAPLLPTDERVVVHIHRPSTLAMQWNAREVLVNAGGQKPEGDGERENTKGGAFKSPFSEENADEGFEKDGRTASNGAGDVHSTVASAAEGGRGPSSFGSGSGHFMGSHSFSTAFRFIVPPPPPPPTPSVSSSFSSFVFHSLELPDAPPPPSTFSSFSSLVFDSLVLPEELLPPSSSLSSTPPTAQSMLMLSLEARLNSNASDNVGGANGVCGREAFWDRIPPGEDLGGFAFLGAAAAASVPPEGSQPSSPNSQTTEEQRHPQTADTPCETREGGVELVEAMECEGEDWEPFATQGILEWEDKE